MLKHGKEVLFFFSLLCLLFCSCSSEQNNHGNNQVTSQPTKPDYLVWVKNLDLTKPLLAGTQTVTMTIQNGGTTPIIGAVARPLYGDFKFFPSTFALPTIQPKQSVDIGIPVNVQSPSQTQNEWRIVYLLMAPMKDPITGKTVYVLPQNGAFEISFQSTDSNDGKKLTSTAYDAGKHQVSKPTTDPYCVNPPADSNYPDGTHIAPESSVGKNWHTTGCGTIPQDLEGVAIWGNFEYDGHGFRVNNLYGFGTTIVLPQGKTGTLTIVFILARKITIKDKAYYQPLGDSFWLLIVVP